MNPGSTSAAKPVPAALAESHTSRLATLACYCLIVASILVCFSPLFTAEFTNWDDPAAISANPRLTNPTLASLGWMWTHPWMQLWVPVTSTVWWCIAKATVSPSGALNPAYFHTANIALHVLSTIFVFRILRRLAHHLPAALIGALIFALHPVQVESVGWASGLKDVLGGLFCLIAIDLYSTQIPRAHVGCLIAFALATLSKPSAAVLPAILFVLEWLVFKRDRKTVSRSLIPMLVVSVACILWSRAAQPSERVIELWKRPAIASHSVAFYGWKLVLPRELCVDYALTPAAIMERSPWFLTWIVPVILVLTAWLMRRRAPLVAGGIAIWLIALLPMLGLVSFDFQNVSNVADHYLYLAMFGVALIIARARRAVLVMLLPVVGALGLQSLRQAQHWHDSRSLFTWTLELIPQSWSAANNLAQDALARNEVDDAERFARLSLSIRRDNPNALGNLALSLQAQGRSDEAIRCLEELLRLNPNSKDAKSLLEKARPAANPDRPAHPPGPK